MGEHVEHYAREALGLDDWEAGRLFYDCETLLDVTDYVEKLLAEEG